MLRLASLFLFSSLAFAQELKTIELEWEPVENAFGYEVRLQREGEKPMFFRTIQSRLTENVPVGVYSLRIRSRHREADLWSAWSEAVRLEVLVKELELLEPKNDSTKLAASTARESVEFKWTPVEKARQYVLSIWTEETKDKPLVFRTKNTSQRLKLIPSEVYYWQVSFESATSVSYVQKLKTFRFTVQGPKLVKPSIAPKFDGTVAWLAVPRAKTYEAKLEFRHLDESNWKAIRGETVETAHWEIGSLPPGAYRVSVVAHAPRNTSSEAGVFEFVVKPKSQDLELKLAEIQ